MKRAILFIIQVILTCSIASAQMKEQRVFLWDVSESLNGNGLWEPLKNNLKNAIQSIKDNPNNRIILIPFYSSCQTVQEVPATQDGKRRLIEFINSKGAKAVSDGRRYTNIVSAIQKFNEVARPDFKNYMFLYTDGKNENRSGSTDMASLESYLNAWENNNSTNIKKYGFYVLVDSIADDTKIRNIGKSKNNFWVIENPNVVVKLLGFRSNNSINVCATENQTNQNAYTLDIPLNGDFSQFSDMVVCSANNDYFDLTFSPKVQEGKIVVSIQPKSDYIPEGHHSIRVNVQKKSNNDPYAFVEDNHFQIECINAPEHLAIVNLLTTDSGQVREGNLGKAIYYAPFLWSDEKQDTIKFYIDTKLNRFASDAGNTFKLKLFGNTDGRRMPINTDDFRVTINSIQTDEFVFSKDTIVEICIIPSKAIPSTHFGGEVVLMSNNGFHRINETSIIDEALFQWNFKYENNMNPLKKWAICIFTLLLIFAVIRILYVHIWPGIRMKGRVRIQYSNAQGFIPYNISGCRKFIFYSKPVSQNIISYLFMGKYGSPRKNMTNEFWTNKLTIKHAGKKRIRILGTSDYLVNGQSLQRGRICSLNQTQITITNTQTNNKIIFNY